uniref:Sulfhydryl oxidase n=1 Tax=Chromera velia CCMP2878 TaxID=1169474 RepID=A0A0G4F336_9ALVE|eukprot:Cvel_2653.t1-p1 / transcript=Cvel_2653.t1 / gene=Cvel_2653 / organism=Chromera_velia_CCMP2878 / gene_product=hypothetical protein / transcript_product=hypothetical protein / location=Cvel_scaffold105:121906-127126(+) / protein_length=711 / sequence_SO=supercontig / SO=protein_coding / is_pseudo=false
MKGVLAFGPSASLFGLAVFCSFVSPVSSQSPPQGGQLRFFDQSPFVSEIRGIPQMEEEVWNNTQTATVVFFYSPFCPKCMGFRRVFEEAAKAFESQYGLDFVAVDCLSEQHLCLRAGAMHFPLVRAFNTPKLQKVVPGLRKLGTRMPVDEWFPWMPSRIVRWLVQDAKLPSPPEELIETMEREWDPMAEMAAVFGQGGLAGLAESADEAHARGVAALDALDLTQQKSISVGDSGREGGLDLKSVQETLHSQPKGGEKKYVPPSKYVGIRSAQGRWSNGQTADDAGVRLADSLNFLQYLLHNRIFLRGKETLSSGETIRLEQILFVLGSSIPGLPFRRSIEDLLRWLGHERVEQCAEETGGHGGVPPLTKEQWDGKMREWRLGLLPRLQPGEVPKSVTCPKNHNLLTCQTWHLLHVLAASADASFAAHPFESPSERRLSFPATPLQIQETVHALVTSFFTCEDCSKHFEESFNSCAFSRCAISELQTDDKEEKEKKGGLFSSPVSSLHDSLDTRLSSWMDRVEAYRQEAEGQTEKVERDASLLRLWLWRLHNSVTLRTATDPSHVLNSVPLSPSEEEEVKGAFEMTSSGGSGNSITGGTVNGTIAVRGERARFGHNVLRYLGRDVRWPSPFACRSCLGNFPHATPTAAVGRETSPLPVSLRISKEFAERVQKAERDRERWELTDLEDTAGFKLPEVSTFLKDFYWKPSFDVM